MTNVNHYLTPLFMFAILLLYVFRCSYYLALGLFNLRASKELIIILIIISG